MVITKPLRKVEVSIVLPIDAYPKLMAMSVARASAIGSYLHLRVKFEDGGLVVRVSLITDFMIDSASRSYAIVFNL